MERHTSIGAKILGGANTALMRTAAEIAEHHRERWDGTGYPYGLAGSEIPLSGRVAAVADVFDALLSERPYKAAWPLERAVATIIGEAGSHCDPAVAEALAANVGLIVEGRATTAA